MLLINAMQESVSVLHTDESDKPISGFAQYFFQSQNLDTMQSYSVFYVYQIIRYLVDQLNTLSGRVYMMPVLSEFYPLFRTGSLTKMQILSRKDWNYLTNRE